MLQPKDYLRSELEAIASEFPFVLIKYGFNDIIDTHIVELIPQSEYYNNSHLQDKWVPLSFSFREKFPEESIAFISNDSDLSLEKAEYELNTNFINTRLFEEFIEEILQKELNYTFPTIIPTIPSINSIGGLLDKPTLDLKSESENSYLIAA